MPGQNDAPIELHTPLTHRRLEEEAEGDAGFERDGVGTPAHQSTSSSPSETHDADGREENPAPRPALTKWQQVKLRIPTLIDWALQPTHMAVVWLMLSISIAGPILLLFQFKLIKAEETLSKEIVEGCMQYLTVLMTLNMLANHPQRCVWLFQKCFRDKHEREYFDRFFPFDAEWPKRSWLLLALLQVNCFAQYSAQMSMSLWGPEDRPQALLSLSVAFGVITGVSIVLLPFWKMQYLSRRMLAKSCTTADLLLPAYESMVIQARLLREIDCRVTIRVDYPGQLVPLEFSTTKDYVV